MSPMHQSCGAACAFYCGRSAMTRSSAVISPRRRLPILRGRCYSSGGIGWSTDRGRPCRAVGVDSGDPFVCSTCWDCRQCPLTADVRRRRPVGVDSRSVRNQSVACPTRLETQTNCVCACARVSGCFET